MSTVERYPAVAAVIFDWGGTLTPWHTVDPVEAWLAATDDADLAARLHLAELEVWQRSKLEHRSATMTDVFSTAGVDLTPAILTAFHGWWEPHTYIDPEAVPLLESLRARGLKIGVLSNTIWSRSEHERIFERDGVAGLIDADVYSSDITHTKPHPEAFRAILGALGIEDPRSAVFVGDRPFDDIHGAKALGMRAILIPHSEIPESQRGHTEGEPDAVVQGLGEILAIIEAWSHEQVEV
jgi:putative hydrolase of the HAD superfamily